MNTTSLAETITYTTECRTINPKTIDANNYKDFCENFDCYELIPDDRKIKPYFDIEIKPEHCNEGETWIDCWEFVAEIAMSKIIKYFPLSKVEILNSSSKSYICCKDGKEKWIISLHLIIYNYKISKPKCLSIVNLMNQEFNKELNNPKYTEDKLNDVIAVKTDFKLFDESVYDPNRKIRSAFANKTHHIKATKQTIREVGRPFIIENNGVFENTVISAFFDPLTTEIADDVVSAPVKAIQNNSISLKLKLLKETDNDKQLEKLIFFAENGFDTFTDHMDFIKIGYALANEFKEKGEDVFLFLAENHTSKVWSDVEQEYKDKYLYLLKQTDKNQVKLGTIYWLFKTMNPKQFQLCNKTWNNNHTGIDMISGIETTGITADYFKELYGDFIITVDEFVYMFDGFKWVKGCKNHTELACFIDKVFYKDLIEYGQERMNLLLPLLATANKEEADLINKKIKLINNYFNQCNFVLRNGTRRANYIADIIKFTTNNKQEFDKNPYLFAFNNKIWDLNNACWIEPEPSQFIYKTAGYNYETIEPTVENDLKLKIMKVLDNIFPNPLVKDYYLTYLATGLSGIQMEIFMIATGIGGNGKGVINGLMMSSVGDYGYIIPSSSLTQEIKMGANPELANLNNIRFGLTTEPDIKKKFCCSTIKTITGDAVLPVRQLYSSKVGVSLNVSLVCEANEVPPFDEVNQAVNRRVKATVFEAVAIDKCDYDKLDADEQYKYCIKNEHYKTAEFKNTYKQIFFDILKNYFTTFKTNKYTLPEMPVSCKQKVLNLLASSDGLYSWFEDQYEKVIDLSKCEPIPLTTIYNSFSSSEYYHQLSKAEQRNNNKKHFIEKIEMNIFLQKYIKRRETRWNTIKQKTDYLVGWKLKPFIDNDIDGFAESK